MGEFTIRPLRPADLVWARQVLVESWGTVEVVSRGELIHADRLPGFVAALGGRPTGLATFRISGQSCEIVTINSLLSGAGVGTALVGAILDKAEETGCRRVWMITTNDNLAALRFFQRRGFRLVAVHVNALERSRQLKPGIPAIGLDGIPLRDEIELEYLLQKDKT